MSIVAPIEKQKNIYAYSLKVKYLAYVLPCVSFELPISIL